MSLWTPSGEHPVDRETSAPSEPARTPAGPPGADGEPSLEDLTPEQRAQYEEMARQMEDAQARMLQLPAGMVVGQQTMQFYELAALYLSQQPARLEDARVAIDALAGVIDKLGVRLGEAEQPLQQALHQLRLAFVQVAGQSGTSGDEPEPAPAAPTGPEADEADKIDEAGSTGGAAASRPGDG
jgi:hypothetical protein